jgi:bacterioferritin (cytochrome b1)
MLELMSFYRDAELRGAALLLRLVRLLADDPDAQVKLTRHVAEETRHAWLWTKRMVDMGGAPVEIDAGYHARIGARTMPRSVAELLALTIVVEARSLVRYREHAARPGVDVETLRVLQAVAADEEWHLEWMRAKLAELVEHDPVLAERVGSAMERYRGIEEQVYAELRAREVEAFSEEPPRPASSARRSEG